MFLRSFIGTWNNNHFRLSDIHAAGVAQPLYPEVILGSLVSVLPMLVLFPFLKRYVARELTLGTLAGQ